MKKLLPWTTALLVVVCLIGKMIPPKEPPGFATGGFGRLPILVNGRVMPIDTLARLSLLAINHHGTCTTTDGQNVPQVRWLLDVFMMPEHADAAKVFEVTNPEVLGLFGWQDTGGKATNYSFNDFKPFLVEIEKQASLAARTEPATRSAFQRGIIKLRNALGLYVQLLNTVQADDSPDFGKELQAFDLALAPGMLAIREKEANKPFNKQDLERILFFARRYHDLGQIKYAYAIPNRNGATDGDRWQHISEALLSAIAAGDVPYPAMIYGRLISAYRNGNADEFNKVIQEYNQYLERAFAPEVNRTRLEFLFNQAQPFLQAMVLYLVVLLFALVSWLKWPKTLGKTALILLLFAFLIHTAGLITRMYVFAGPASRNEPVQLGHFCRLGIGSSLPVSRTLLHERHWER